MTKQFLTILLLRSLHQSLNSTHWLWLPYVFTENRLDPLFNDCCLRSILYFQITWRQLQHFKSRFLFRVTMLVPLNGVQNWILINDLALLVLHKSGGQYAHEDIGSLQSISWGPRSLSIFLAFKKEKCQKKGKKRTVRRRLLIYYSTLYSCLSQV